MRIVAGSVLGGLYSAVILIDDIPIYISFLSKILAAVLILLISFSFKRVKSFITVLLIFLFSNFLFLGIIIGGQMLFASDKIAVNNGAVYFDISARGLLLSAFLSYVLSCIIVRIYNRRLSAGEIYTLVIENNSKTVSLFALTDTGNKLKEPFSNYPVIIAKKDLLLPLIEENKARLIPASTVNSQSLLLSFKPDKVTVRTAKGSETIENVYVALSDEINSKNFSAVLNPEILSV